VASAEAPCSAWPSFWATRPALADQQSDPDCDESCANGDERGTLPGASNCQEDDTEGEEYGTRSPCSRRGTVWSVGHAPNGLELTGDGGAAAGVRCSDVLGAGVVGLVAMGLLPPYARDGGSSRCQGVHRAGGAGLGRESAAAAG